ncbi:hypothetical protein CALCODRAFT_494417 [Calocera cornea HHB12733]|uniref:CUE domain-containing protein n=1 Tax=Calocera cornea HHB12733 TaxID=1353952 RepID=A0A165H6M7_9BASI|nr:hypothetical protein CALCODRAFT_494417 [Calocera cornea HHB12733]
MTEKTPEQIEQPAAASEAAPSSNPFQTGTEASEQVLEKLQETKADEVTTTTESHAAPVSPPPPAPITTTVGQADEVTDPRIAALQAIFPDFDPTVLASVLDACDGDQERAIEMLLGMSDPSYVPAEAIQSQHQTDLDEQLAHRLMLEEEENAARSGNPSSGGQGQIRVPYQPRQRAPRRAAPPQGGGYPVSTGPSGTGQGGMGTGAWSGVDTAQIQDQFSKMAETGKKTFSSFFSKMKQKMQELDKPVDGTDPENQPMNASEWNQSARRAALNTEADDFTLPSAAPQGTKPQGYSVGRGPFQAPPGPPPKTNSPFPRGGVTIREPSSESGHPAIGSSSSSSPPPAQIDVSKINLMPKRPVSLGVTGSNAPRKEDEDDLEYVENPFEDR